MKRHKSKVVPYDVIEQVVFTLIQCRHPKNIKPNVRPCTLNSSV